MGYRHAYPSLVCSLPVHPPPPAPTPTGSAATDALFDKELKKYGPLQADVARNVARNEELLAAVSRDAQVGLWV